MFPPSNSAADDPAQYFPSTSMLLSSSASDSLRVCCGVFDASVFRENGPYLSLWLDWEDHFFCRMGRIHVSDALGRRRVLDRGRNGSIIMESVDEFPLLHQSKYRFNYEYRCLPHRMWKRRSYTTPKGGGFRMYLS